MASSTNNSLPFLLLITLLLLLSATLVSSECTCDSEDSTKDDDKSETKKLRIASLFVILIASCIGISLPVLGKNIPTLSPEANMFFMVKAFAAGVILATGFIHVLPDAFEELTSPCLNDHPWHKFPFGGFVAMLGAIGSLMIDAGATGYFRRMQSTNKGSSVGVGGGGAGDEETNTEAGQVGVHTHGSHGGGENLASRLELIRHRVTSQVLELGIMVHSVIIGITIGTSQSIKTIRTLMVALAFHQFFEGMGLGGCIAQAKFKGKTIMLMGLLFSITTPLGVAIGIIISDSYNDTDKKSLIIQGVLDSAAAGILIYMALVDLLAADFLNPKVQKDMRLQLGVSISLLLGAGCMSVLAYWA